ncbi:DUF4140 domain-containing protein [Paracoccus kondratievae]
MRHLLLSTAILAAGPAFADRIEATARVTDVTVYPWGASVTREASLDLPDGAHELVIPGIPEGIDPASLRVTAKGAVIGATGFQQERALPETPAKSPHCARQSKRSAASNPHSPNATPAWPESRPVPKPQKTPSNS